MLNLNHLNTPLLRPTYADAHAGAISEVRMEGYEFGHTYVWQGPVWQGPASPQEVGVQEVSVSLADFGRSHERANIILPGFYKNHPTTEAPPVLAT